MYQNNEWKERSVAGTDLGKMNLEELIDFALAKKKIVDFAKAELEVITAQIQERAIAFQEDRHIKFTEWHGSTSGIASVTVSGSLDILNVSKLKEVLGEELVQEKLKVKQAEVKYDLEDTFKKAVTALLLDDYESSMSVEEVIDHAGWCEDCPDKKKLLLKKLKGDYKKDKKTVLDVLHRSDADIDIDTELFVIYQIKNYEKILAYFDEDTLGETKEKLKRYVAVDETAKIMLKVV